MDNKFMMVQPVDIQWVKLSLQVVLWILNFNIQKNETRHNAQKFKMD